MFGGSDPMLVWNILIVLVLSSELNSLTLVITVIVEDKLRAFISLVVCFMGKFRKIEIVT